MRIGLVGTGSWARAVQGAGAHAHPDWDLVGVWGRDPAKAAELAAALDCAPAPTFEELLSQVDALAFAVPPHVQVPLALQAARAGKHLLLEKPIALEVGAAEQLVSTVAESGVTALVFLTRLWSPHTANWLAEQRAVGDWTSGRANFVAALPDAFLDGSPWRREHGALWDVGPHALSVLEAVLGPVTDVRAVQGERDLVQLVCRHESGATSSAELTLTAPADAALTDASFWGKSGRSAPWPVLEPAAQAEHVHLAMAAALSALHERVTSHPADVRYGAHLTSVLARAQAGLTG